MKHRNNKKRYQNPEAALFVITSREDILNASGDPDITLPVETDHDPDQGEWV